MPIKVITNTINEGMRSLPRQVKQSALSLLESSGEDSLKEINGRVKNNEFWINRSMNAANSIKKEVVDNGDSITVAIGFEKGKPNEKDAPEYYKSGRNREYAEYISDRQETHFLGAVLQSLSRNVVKQLDGFRVRTERATRISK